MEIIFNQKKEIVYIIEKIEVPRGIRNKNKGTAKEVLIFGMNFEKFEKLFNCKIERKKQNEKNKIRIS